MTANGGFAAALGVGGSPAPARDGVGAPDCLARIVADSLNTDAAELQQWADGSALRINPSASQREAIEAPREALLVLAGPGAGKTFCLIERIRFLIERMGLAPERLCAFTFTNKAAGEIADRLGRSLGNRAALVKTGTIHAFCAELLREFGDRVGLERGFGIVDERQQRAVDRKSTRLNSSHSSI